MLISLGDCSDDELITSSGSDRSQHLSVWLCLLHSSAVNLCFPSNDLKTLVPQGVMFFYGSKQRNHKYSTLIITSSNHWSVRMLIIRSHKQQARGDRVNGHGDEIKSCLTFLQGPLGLPCIGGSGFILSYNSKILY